MGLSLCRAAWQSNRKPVLCQWEGAQLKSATSRRYSSPLCRPPGQAWKNSARATAAVLRTGAAPMASWCNASACSSLTTSSLFSTCAASRDFPVAAHQHARCVYDTASLCAGSAWGGHVDCA